MSFSSGRTFCTKSEMALIAKLRKGQGQKKQQKPTMAFLIHPLFTFLQSLPILKEENPIDLRNDTVYSTYYSSLT